MMKLNRILAGLCLALCLSGVANAATLLPNGRQQFISANGAPLAGGTVAFYIPNTSTPKDTWRDASQAALNQNPVVLDAAGTAVIYGVGAYRQVVKDAAGNTLWDQVTSDVSGAGLSWGGISIGSANAQTVTAANFNGTDGQVVSFIAGFTSTGAVTLNVNGRGAANVLNDTPSGSVSLSGGEIVAGNVVTVTYTASTGVFHTFLPTSTIPTGVVQIFAGNTPPAGFVLCYGQALSRATYARLFSVIGTSFGSGDGSTTFNVPDMRGRVPSGRDDMGGTDAARLAGSSMNTARLVLGGGAGEGTHTLSIAELPVITPTGTVSVTFPNYSYNQGRVLNGAGFGNTGSLYQLVNDVAAVASPAAPSGSFSLSIAPFGSGSTHNVVQPSLTVTYIIKL